MISDASLYGGPEETRTLIRLPIISACKAYCVYSVFKRHSLCFQRSTIPL
nr:MAG TPA: hypothetical protein [Caudoviricetes sp.]